ncbi:hypothetical protein [Halomicronema hongdechloris]|nr:hypothetical protein [Halomicronema hongdechloris]
MGLEPELEPEPEPEAHCRHHQLAAPNQPETGLPMDQPFHRQPHLHPAPD